MFGWRSKVLVALIIYFAGFASAIYALAPATDRPEREIKFDLGRFSKSDSGDFGEKSKDFAAKAETGIRKFLSLAEEKAAVIGEKIKQELAEQNKGEAEK